MGGWTDEDGQTRRWGSGAPTRSGRTGRPADEWWSNRAVPSVESLHVNPLRRPTMTDPANTSEGTTENADVEAKLTTEALIEEVSIDGMCGVY